jgi:hypothetical protein
MQLARSPGHQVADSSSSERARAAATHAQEDGEMLPTCTARNILIGAASGALLTAGGATVAVADEPCGDLDECRALIEINASDGDIGFHALFDAEGWREARIDDPNGLKILQVRASNELREQSVTEGFFESAEPVCEEHLAEDEDDEVLTLPEFLDRFAAGEYTFSVKLDDSETFVGATELTHNIPAAPADVSFDGSVISWEYGSDLGECTTLPSGFALAAEEDIVGYEVVMEPEDEALAPFTFTVRVLSNGPVYNITVPPDYLASLPADTPLKVEVGAIERRPNGSFGNQTFTEEGGFCSNPDQTLCPEPEE